MELNEFLELLEEDGLLDMIEVVKEPEFSKQKLLAFQSEFKMSSIHFYELYISGLLENQLPKDKMEEWAYNYKIFIQANGDQGELLSTIKDNLDDGERGFPLLF